jgi:fatty acid desaturase
MTFGRALLIAAAWTAASVVLAVSYAAWRVTVFWLATQPSKFEPERWPTADQWEKAHGTESRNPRQ